MNKKSSYEKPKLTNHGKLKEVTAGGGDSGGDSLFERD